MAASAFYVSDDDPGSKREILKATLKLFARDGIDGTNIRAIAAEAGYTNPALFKFFDNKESLALYLFERCFHECLLAIRATLAEKASFPARMRATVRGFAAFVDAYPEAFFYVHDNSRRLLPKASETTRKHTVVGEFRKLLRQGRSEGVVNDGVPLEIQLAAVTGFLFQIARSSYFGDFKGDLSRHAGGIEAMIARMLA
jgi:AcrR family transcriptional regulator